MADPNFRKGHPVMYIKYLTKPLLLALALLLLVSCGRKALPSSLDVTEESSEAPSSSALLEKTDDLGKTYLGGFVFLGGELQILICRCVWCGRTQFAPTGKNANQ